jgi:hypothetical protein
MIDPNELIEYYSSLGIDVNQCKQLVLDSFTDKFRKQRGKYQSKIDNLTSKIITKNIKISNKNIAINAKVKDIASLNQEITKWRNNQTKPHKSSEKINDLELKINDKKCRISEYEVDIKEIEAEIAEIELEIIEYQSLRDNCQSLIRSKIAEDILQWENGMYVLVSHDNIIKYYLVPPNSSYNISSSISKFAYDGHEFLPRELTAEEIIGMDCQSSMFTNCNHAIGVQLNNFTCHGDIHIGDVTIIN